MVAIVIANDVLDGFLCQEVKNIWTDQRTEGHFNRQRVTRVLKHLRHARILTIGQLARWSEKDLRLVRGFGASSITLVRESLGAWSLNLEDVRALGRSQVEVLLDEKIGDALGPYCFTKFHEYSYPEMEEAFRFAGILTLRGYLEHRTSQKLGEGFRMLSKKTMSRRSAHQNLVMHSVEKYATEEALEIESHFKKLIPVTEV